jgi:hypothetical protein
MNVIDALHSKDIFGPLFKDLSTWHAWEVYLRGLFGLPIETAEDRVLFKDCTGLEGTPGEKVRESYVIAGRRSGKSYTSALIAVFLACFKDWRPYLAPGEKGWIFIIAVDKAQAGIIKAYISGIFQRVKCLRGLIAKETQETIELRNGISIAVKTASFRSVRGYTLLACVLEEMAFYRSDDSANPDKEILAAVRPALATIPESLLLGISTPYNRSGVLWEQFKSNYGKPGGPLIWKAPTRTMNPTIDRRLIENALREDPQAARAEWEAEWREDIEAFITQDLVEAVMIQGRFELPKIDGPEYFGFIDPSGGRQDAFTLGICHREGSGKIVLDVLRERCPPFQPKGVVAELTDVLKSFGISSVESDKYAGEWVPEAFREFGIEVKNAAMTASELYLNFLPLVSNGTVELLDNKRLLAQLLGLERRSRSGGKDLITHYAGGHSDLANAVAGACVLASQRRVMTSEEMESMLPVVGRREGGRVRDNTATLMDEWMKNCGRSRIVKDRREP